MVHFKEVVHYSKDDEECQGEYWQIDIFKDGILIVTYGDHYHDKGREKAEGFYDAISKVLEAGTWSWEYEEIADMDY